MLWTEKKIICGEGNFEMRGVGFIKGYVCLKRMRFKGLHPFWDVIFFMQNGHVPFLDVVTTSDKVDPADCNLLERPGK